MFLSYLLSATCHQGAWLFTSCFCPGYFSSYSCLSFWHGIHTVPGTRRQVLLSPTNSSLSEASLFPLYSDLNIYSCSSPISHPQCTGPHPSITQLKLCSENTQERKQKFNSVSIPPSLCILHLHLTEVPDISFSGTSEAVDMDLSKYNHKNEITELRVNICLPILTLPLSSHHRVILSESLSLQIYFLICEVKGFCNLQVLFQLWNSILYLTKVMVKWILSHV